MNRFTSFFFNCFLVFSTLSFGFLLSCSTKETYPIDRKLVVGRHEVGNTTVDSLNSMIIGNGRFAYSVDITGMQSFPEVYENGLSLGTYSDWGWHSFLNPSKYSVAQTLATIPSHGRKIPYSVEHTIANKPAQNASVFYRENPHRVHLGILGLEFSKNDSTLAELSDLSKIKQSHNLWTGELTSNYVVGEVPVKVNTLVGRDRDIVSVKLKSKLISEGKMRISLKFPFPVRENLSKSEILEDSTAHVTTFHHVSGNMAVFTHTMDSTLYHVYAKGSTDFSISESNGSGYIIQADTTKEEIDFSFEFTPTTVVERLPTYNEVAQENTIFWEQYWTKGGFVDFSAVEDERGYELERRMILSLYHSVVSLSNRYPGGRSGVISMSGLGRSRVDQNWWSAAHYALWGRSELLENTLKWYSTIEPQARLVAERQGFEGVRWPQTSDFEGLETPSDLGVFSLEHQPNPIYFAELVYRNNPTDSILNLYADLVFSTADFMASYAWLDPESGFYKVENDARKLTTKSPINGVSYTYARAYWKWSLGIAQKWRLRLGMNANAKWTEVLNKLDPLAMEDGKYVYQSVYDSSDEVKLHPKLNVILGFLPNTDWVDEKTMANTFDAIYEGKLLSGASAEFHALAAMTATRLGDREKALELLYMTGASDTFLGNGVFYSTLDREFNLCGNGSFLSALALMAGGFEESDVAPGFPKSWKVKVEGITKLP